MERYVEEFGAGFKPEPEIVELLAIDGVSDGSWHNNVCPNLEKQLESGIAELWFDHPEPAEREMENKRYLVLLRHLDDSDCDGEPFYTDSAREAAAKFRELIAG